MNVLEGKKLTEAINSIFKPESAFIVERNNIIEKIIEINYKKYKPNEDKKETIEELDTLRDFLFEKYKNKYQEPLIINGFFNKAIFNIDSVSYIESIEYNKQYLSDSFRVLFFFEDSKIKELTLQYLDKESHIFYMEVELDKEIKVKELIITSQYNNIYLSDYEINKKGEYLLSTIKEESLFSLDSSEISDFSLMLYDEKLNLSQEPLYNSFKNGLNDFFNVIKEELSLNNKIQQIKL